MWGWYVSLKVMSPGDKPYLVKLRVIPVIPNCLKADVVIQAAEMFCTGAIGQTCLVEIPESFYYSN